MGFYNKFILPKIIDVTCKKSPNMKQREKVVPLAKGNVLEIGVGPGFNLPFYNQEKVKHLTAIDPVVEIWNKNTIDVNALPFGFEFFEAYAEDIPLDNNSMDTVLFTYTLCSIPNTTKAFEEIRRVLKPNGQLIFCEHGKAPDKAIQKWQNLANPIWKKLGGGCSLNRNIPSLIRENGMKINTMDTMYIPGWKPASFNYWGTAEIR